MQASHRSLNTIIKTQKLVSYKNITLPTGKKKKIKLMQMLHDGCPVAFLLLLSPSFLSDLNEIEKGLRARSYHTIHLNDVWHSVVSLLTGFPGIAVTRTITNNIHNNI